MKTMSTRVNEIQLSGDWHSMGVALGRRQADEIRAFNDRFFFSSMGPFRFGSLDRVWAFAARILTYTRSYSSNWADFMTGVAEGASLPVEQVVAQNCLPELTHVTEAAHLEGIGCTAAYVNAQSSATRSAFLFQNWDFNIELPRWYVLKLFPPLDEPSLMVVGAGAMFACCGLSSMGVAATFTSSGHLPNSRIQKGVPLVATLIEVLLCPGFHEALAVAAAPRRAGAYNMLVADEYTHGAVIEAVCDCIEIIDEGSILVSANHFQHPEMVSWVYQELEPDDAPHREFADSTVSRAKRLTEILDAHRDTGIDMATIRQCLSDHENKPFSICAHAEGTILGFATRGSVILEPAQRALHFCAAQPCEEGFRKYNL